jgi:hypothetical protein
VWSGASGRRAIFDWPGRQHRVLRADLVAVRIDTDGLDELNSVSLYLPHYDKDEVAKIVSAFVGDADVEVPVAVNPSSPDASTLAPVDRRSADHLTGRTRQDKQVLSVRLSWG